MWAGFHNGRMATGLRDAISTYDQKAVANRLVDRTVAMIIGKQTHADHVEVLRAHRRITKESVSPLNQVTQDDIRREGTAFRQVFMRDSALNQIIVGGAIEANVGDRVVSSTHDPVADWVLEGNPMVVGGLDLGAVTLKSAKTGCIFPMSNELGRFSDPRGPGVVRSVLVRVDRDSVENKLFGDDAAVDFASPAGLLNGLSSAGDGSPDSLDDSLIDLWHSVRDGNPGGPRFVMSPRAAVYLHTLRDEDGDAKFPTVNPATGGTLLGVPVILSKQARQNLVLLDCQSIAIADDGIEISLSGQSALQFSNSPTPGASQLIPLWQTNCTALKLIHYVTWAKVDSDGVGFIELPLVASPD